jgi:hypothetical protein
MPVPRFNRCVFCGNVGKLTAEHVFPAWTTNWVPGAGTAAIRHEMHGRQAVNYEKRDLDVKSRAVCETCNNTWMAKLETRIIPILGPLMASTEPAVVHGRTHRLIAWWAAKTAAMLDTVHPDRVIPIPAYQAIRHDREPAPSTMGIWMGCYHIDEKPDWHHLRTTINTLPGTGQEITGYVSTFRLGHLWFQVLDVFTPTSAEMTQIRGTFQVWPLTGWTFDWPPGNAALNAEGFTGLHNRFTDDRHVNFVHYPA